MAISFIQLPGDSTGKLVDTSLTAVTSQHRENVCIADPSVSAGIATVTSSAGLLVSISSGIVSMSSVHTIVSASSGVIQVLTTGTLLVSMSSATVTLSSVHTFVSASSGLIQTLSSGAILLTTGTIIGLSSGTVTLSSNPTVISASSGLVQTLSSGAVVLTTGTIIGLSSGTVTLSSAPVVNSASSGFVQTLTTGPTVLSTQTHLILSMSSGFVQPVPVTTGGILSFTYVSSSSGNSNNVKGTAGVFYGFYAYNSTVAGIFLKVYGTSSAPTVGSTAAQIGNFGIPASTGTGGAGAQHVLSPYGVTGTGGISFTMVSGMEATSTGSISNAVVALNVYYI